MAGSDSDNDVEEMLAGSSGMAVVPRHAAYVEVTGSLLFGAGDMLEQVSGFQGTCWLA